MSASTAEVGYGTARYEENYFEYVKRLYLRFFKPKKFRVLRRLAIELRFQSNEAQQILMDIGFKKGRKIEGLRAPVFVFKSHKFMKNFVKGLVDTDGHVQLRRSVNHHYLIITWSSTSKDLAIDVFEILVTLGFHPSQYSVKGPVCDGCTRRIMNRVSLYRKADVSRYLSEIGFSNSMRWFQVKKKSERIGEILFIS